MLVDLVNEVLSAALIAPQAITTTSTVGNTITAASTYLDMNDCHVATGAILDIGNVQGTSPQLGVQVEESDADAGWTWTAIPGLIFAAQTTSNQHIVQRGLRTRRYVRANVITAAGATPTIVAGLEVIAARKFEATTGKFGGYDRSPSS